MRQRIHSERHNKRQTPRSSGWCCPRCLVLPTRRGVFGATQTTARGTHGRPLKLSVGSMPTHTGRTSSGYLRIGAPCVQHGATRVIANCACVVPGGACLSQEHGHEPNAGACVHACSSSRWTPSCQTSGRTDSLMSHIAERPCSWRLTANQPRSFASIVTTRHEQCSSTAPPRAASVSCKHEAGRACGRLLQASALAVCPHGRRATAAGPRGSLRRRSEHAARPRAERRPRLRLQPA